MKKKFVLSLILISLLPLTSCGGVKAFDWWDTENLSIVQSILEKDAMDAYQNSLTNRYLLTSRKTSYTVNTYYKDYLGNFVTETDSNITESKTIFEDRYNNDVNVFVTKDTLEESYKTSHTNGVTTIDTYHVGESENKKILERVITNYGYGAKIGTERIFDYTDEDSYKAALYIETPSINTSTKLNYGLSKNGNIIIESIQTKNKPYKVAFSGLEINECVENDYSLFRFNEIEAGQYVLNYYHNVISVQIGKDCLGNQYSEPFTLEKKETVSAFYISEMTSYDKTLIPVIPD